jgi:hypothetical protein
MGGFHESYAVQGGLVNGPAFGATFDIDANTSAGANRIAIIVAIVRISDQFAHRAARVTR